MPSSGQRILSSTKDSNEQQPPPGHGHDESDRKSYNLVGSTAQEAAAAPLLTLLLSPSHLSSPTATASLCATAASTPSSTA